MQPAHRARGEGASAQAQTLRVQDTEENQEEGRLSQVLFWFVIIADPVLIRDFWPVIDTHILLMRGGMGLFLIVGQWPKIRPQNSKGAS